MANQKYLLQIDSRNSWKKVMTRVTTQSKMMMMMIPLMVALLVASFAAILVAISMMSLPSPHPPLPPPSSPSPSSSPFSSNSTNQVLNLPLHSFIETACPDTLYSSLCFSVLSAMPPPDKQTLSRSVSFPDVLAFTINRTAAHVESARIDVVEDFQGQDLRPPERIALQDCLEMLDQTRYELQQAIGELISFPSLNESYGGVKTLLSAAMTNENTCINGFLDLNQMRRIPYRHRRGWPRPDRVEQLQRMLTPISHMISNSLALIKHVENTTPLKKPNPFLKAKIFKNYGSTVGLRRVVVAADGSGNYKTIGEAIAMAPNMSPEPYMINVKAGTYKENVVIPRQKMNIMLIGEGMKSTIITAARSFADGFSTFESATLTVTGDKFFARDLTIRNTAAPEKHQAVALTVSSNAAFYRCEIISHQDTLYAHSLRQLYRHCFIQGTVDFIFGNAAALFQNCTILVRKPLPGQRNMITAQGRDDPNQNTGIILENCTIKAAKEFSLSQRKRFPTYLGRPWRNYSRTIVVNSYLGDLIHPRGWFEWNEHTNVDTVEYIEYKNFGPGADTRRRISWAGYQKNCSEENVKQFRAEEFLHGADDWLQTTVFPLLSS